MDRQVPSEASEQRLPPRVRGRRGGPRSNTVLSLIGEYSRGPRSAIMQTGYAPYANSIIGRIFHLLCEHPYGLSTSELVDALYQDDINGGPLAANRCISVMVHKFNSQAVKSGIGLRIHLRAGDKVKRGGSGGRYCIWIVKP